MARLRRALEWLGVVRPSDAPTPRRLPLLLVATSSGLFVFIILFSPETLTRRGAWIPYVMAAIIAGTLAFVLRMRK